ncbi:hypothetical protein [Lewinella cohaerens]|uniref:hypothetical protein n=1 Tax=Lewinella cohaerens TaxID=70995 RepID=UPI0003687DF4|nr:hypothetical protein [Lewinella cohaerens]
MSIQEIIPTRKFVTELLQNIDIEEDQTKIEQFTIALKACQTTDYQVLKKSDNQKNRPSQ